VQDVPNVPDDVRPKRPLNSWFDVRRRRLGSWAFALNRLTGIGLTLYLLIHLGLLSLLLQGEEAWDDFVALARSPFFLTLDVFLLFGILFHGLNGIRLVLVGIGVGIRNQRSMFWVLMVIGFVLLATGAILIFTL
jgi:succinate dehydrogenase / fumarate reductase cytochrome b subunit